MLSPEGAELLLASIDAADDFAAIGLNATRSDAISMLCFPRFPKAQVVETFGPFVLRLSPW